MSERLTALTEWLHDDLRLVDINITQVSGDASFRRYFRITGLDGASRVVMDAPPDHEDCRPFVQIAERLHHLGLHVPAIYAQDLQQGFLLLEDLGSVHYLDLLDEQRVERLYGDALAALAVVQACAPTDGLPVYDGKLLLQEMELFRHWLLQRHLGMTLTGSENQMLDGLFELLMKSALEQPRVFVLRDFHSRNLMVATSPTPGILDFQDAVAGPVTYDLVSLLKDCYISWSTDRVKGWASGYFQLAVQSGVLQQQQEAYFLRWFDLMGVQRHLKAAGIFARLHLRDGKPGYLGDIPRTLGYILQLEPAYPELEGLCRLIRKARAE
ncbi:MAG: phosphotransferase [Gammaproteobacteria bacterium]|nr:phosphotransferase [Gammaproteobacteria bacterium]